MEFAIQYLAESNLEWGILSAIARWKLNNFPEHAGTYAERAPAAFTVPRTEAFVRKQDPRNDPFLIGAADQF